MKRMEPEPYGAGFGKARICAELTARRASLQRNDFRAGRFLRKAGTEDWARRRPGAGGEKYGPLSPPRSNENSFQPK